VSALARPAVLAALLAGTAAVLHPALGTASWLGARDAVLAALALLATIALGARARGSRAAGERFLAAGAGVLLLALAADGLLAHHGSMRLVAGQARPHFDEKGPDGGSLGLRPFGFPVVAEAVSPDGAVTLALPSGRAVVTADRAASSGGWRFARPRAALTGGATRLRVAASDGARTFVADVAPGAPGLAGDATVVLEEYFPDFALDERQAPFTRSLEPRNPAALLRVERGGESHRAFVLRSMPGVHRVEPLGLAFSLLDVEPERAADLDVHREPAAPFVLLGGLLVLAALVLQGLRPAGPTADRPSSGSLVAAGAATLALLVVTDGARVLAWSFGLPSVAGRVPLAGAGVLLGGAVVFTLAGTLLLGARRLSGGAAGSPAAGRVALWAGVALLALGLGVAAVRVALLDAGSRPSVLPLLALAAGLVVLVAALRATRPAAAPAWARLAERAVPAGAAAAALAALVLGVLAVGREGTYATGAVAAASAAALLGRAALEPTAVRGALRGALLVALASLLLG
jgi:hypothetical protein